MGFLAFFAGPIGRWVVVAALVLMALFAAYNKGTSSGYKEAADEIHAHYRAQEQAWLKAMGAKQNALNALTAKFDKRAAELEKELQGKERERLELLKKLRERMPNVQTCAGDRVTVGYVWLRDELARWANDDRTPAPAAPGPDVANTASDLSSRDLADADAGQAEAFRACKARVDGWRQYHQEVEAWHAEVNKALGNP